MKSIFSLLIVLMSAVSLLSAQTEVTITDSDLEGSQVYNWASTNTYLLEGIVVLEAGGTLNIEPGTVIKGKTLSNGGSALIIAQGAQIFAEGTSDNPIIFTSELDDVNNPDDLNMDDRGLWGGLIVLGSAPLASENGIDYVPGPFMPGSVIYGGDNVDDNSGVLTYLSIRHAGDEIAPGEELNGLTLGGVGQQTVVEHIEVYACQDDGIELHGGTVNLKYLSVSFCSDESFDWDLGWRGKGQFWLGVQDEDSDRMGEHDGGQPDTAEPFSRPVISNVTYIGPGSDIEPSNVALLFRDRSGGIYTNSIFTNFPDKAIQIEDLVDVPDSHDHIETGNLLLRCNYWWNFGGGNTWNDLVALENSYEDSLGVAVIDHMNTNQNDFIDPQIVNIDPDPAVFDPRLTTGSPALTAACPLDDSFFMPVNYIGAFGEEDVWLQDWSGMAANEFFAFLATDTKEPEFVESQISVYPNPAKSVLTIELEQSPESFIIHNAAGKIISRQLVNHQSNRMTLNIADYPAGLYWLSLNTGKQIVTKKFVVAK